MNACKRCGQADDGIHVGRLVDDATGLCQWCAVDPRDEVRECRACGMKFQPCDPPADQWTCSRACFEDLRACAMEHAAYLGSDR